MAGLLKHKLSLLSVSNYDMQYQYNHVSSDLSEHDMHTCNLLFEHV